MPQPKSSGGRSRRARKASPAKRSGSPSRATAKKKTASARRPAARKSAAKPTTRKAPARKKGSARRAPARKAASSSNVDAVREALSRVANPLDLVIVTRDRVQEIVDEAVERGRITRGDAEDLVRDILKSARSQTEDLIAQVGRATKMPQVDRVAREVDKARRAVGVGPSFPIMRFDDLTAGQITDRLTDLTAAELRKVRDYERRNANRKSVLDAIERKLG